MEKEKRRLAFIFDHVNTKRKSNGFGNGYHGIFRRNGFKKLWEYISETWNLKDNPDWDKDERGNVQEFSWMSEPLDAETTEKLEKYQKKLLVIR